MLRTYKTLHVFNYLSGKLMNSHVSSKHRVAPLQVEQRKIVWEVCNVCWVTANNERIFNNSSTI